MADGSPLVDVATARPLTVVGFAGGGGSSVAIKLATGCDPDLAMNHWLTAVLAHQRHFPQTEHHCADIFDVDPRTWRPGEHIAFGWFSPDCTDFSKAKGGAPKSERIRGLAWSIMPWLVARRPDVVIIENVEEFEYAGPVYRCLDDWRAKGVPGEVGQPIKALRGQTFQRIVTRVRKMGGTIEWRVINAADFGAPTTRKRLYVIIRLDGKPIVWPAPTHAKRTLAAGLGLKPWRGACEIIDWSQDCPSIFLDPAEVEELRRATGKWVQRPLVAATLKRVARGMERYVIGAAEPFIVPVTQRGWGGDRAHGVRDPMKTILSSKGGEFAVADPQVAMMSSNYGSNTRGGRGNPEDPTKTQVGTNHSGVVQAKLSAGLVGVGGRRGQSPPVAPTAPMPTGTGKADAAEVEASIAIMTSVAHGDGRERAGLRAWDVEDPTRTQTEQNDKALVTGALVRTNFHSAAARNGIRDVEEPTATATGDGGIGLTSAVLVPRYGEREGQEPRCIDIEAPVPTPVPTGNQGSLAAATLVRQFGTSTAADVEEPAGAIMPEGAGKTGVVAAYMAQGNREMVGRPAEAPVTTATARGTQQQLIAASLDTYYSAPNEQGADVGGPLRTSTGKDRHSLIAAWLEQANTGNVGHAMPAPVSTIMAGGGRGAVVQRLIEARLEVDGGPIGRRGKVLGFLWSHFGLPTAEEWAAPAATLQARLKFGLVIIAGQVWMIVDIGLRMLLPKELAAAMGLPPEYDLTVNAHGDPISKTHQTQMIGNMVSPPPAAALIAANFPGLIQPEQRRAA